MENDKKIHKKAMGNITQDPATTLPIGTKLEFCPVVVNHDFANGAVWLKKWGSFEGVLLSLCFSNSQFQRVEGSGVLVAPGIALCARHVIQPHLENMLRGETSAISFALMTDALLIWRIVKITICKSTDIAILGLELASDLPPEGRFKQAIITTRMPSEGEALLIVGFRAECRFGRGDGEILPIEGNVLASTGLVTQQYPTGRDRFHVTWPTLEVRCPAWGGMSGGPVFDKNGLLIGLLTTSFSADDNQGPSYISLLWPALGEQFEGGWPHSLFPGSTCLLQLDPRFCAIDKREAVEVVSDIQNNRIAAEYRRWE